MNKTINLVLLILKGGGYSRGDCVLPAPGLRTTAHARLKPASFAHHLGLTPYKEMRDRAQITPSHNRHMGQQVALKAFQELIISSQWT